MIQLFLAGFFEEYHGDRDLQSAAFTEEFVNPDKEEDEMVMGPFSKICEHMALGLDVRLDHRVKEINYSGAKVLVTCEGESFEADRIIVTVPVGVMKSGNLKFVPELPPYKLDVYDRTEILYLNCFYLNFEEVFWTDEFWFGYLGDDTRKFCIFVNQNRADASRKTLKIMVNGRFAKEVESWSDETVLEEIMKNLRDIYGSEIPNPIKFHRSNWASNPNTLGAGFFRGIRSKSTDIDDFAKSVDEKIFFAGDYTCEEEFGEANGNTHGAYSSGLREANKIITLVNGS